MVLVVVEIVVLGGIVVGVVFVAACYVLFNIAVDVAQSLLDPRIKT